MAINGGNYSYPLDPTWTAEELIAVTNFYRVVEDAYETGGRRQRVLDCYQAFKKVVPTKVQEKQLGRDFYRVSGYQCYDVVKAAKETTKGQLKIGG
ncbi:UNVERIFIED_CONTAM: hypothetical protein DV033_02165 [Limosilactobacillus fermentum]|uniref:UPF0223 family protein n=1 Tax=Limosilactobacillus fermentum TaxID=1613 RepID=A0AAJ6A1X8_LIMFE|nr:UPF0223 family protein [Limosilactobacillus fermentum]MBE4709481.1 UPF0223 family protein [Limosilactobacillus fermentum]MED7634641.1 hypothetical protein [Limosilactobacillus fermentum]PTV36681.1 hypothetical protein DB329_03360 [Limosilactobacillus fermentum]QAR23630.1 UPF0223 family protein [Limosilactobacillus fermentum]WFR89792.1 UPF0223 family protein [Limosilactobacillus fermentum]